jgi:hypothetical protein
VRKRAAGRKPAPGVRLDKVEAQARKHAAGAMVELARLASGAESETVRLAAIKELLARAFGASAQDLPQVEQVIRWARTSEEATPDPSKAEGHASPPKASPPKASPPKA